MPPPLVGRLTISPSVRGQQRGRRGGGKQGSETGTDDNNNYDSDTVIESSQSPVRLLRRRRENPVQEVDNNPRPAPAPQEEDRPDDETEVEDDNMLISADYAVIHPNYVSAHCQMIAAAWFHKPNCP